MGGFSATTTTTTTWNWNWNSSDITGSGQLDAKRALDILYKSPALTDVLERGTSSYSGSVPHCGCMPPPQVDLSGAPAGRGLTTNEDGWPKGTVTTAGGYRIVPEGNTNWNIYAPGQKAGDTPHTRIWGDPHVVEKDGTKWDFTKSSDFVLGDGTRIFARTSAETGQSVTTGLDIVNGADRVSVNNLNTGNPEVSGVRHDGYEWRAAHLASDPNRDTFHLRGDQDNVHWVRERNGQLDGVVTGANYDAKTQRYEQTVDNNPYVGLDPTMRPPFGSRAWGNQLRGEINDIQAAEAGRNWGPLGVYGAVGNAMGIHQEHNQAAFWSNMRDLFFGGWGSYFPSFEGSFNALSALRDLMLSDSDWRRSMRFDMNATIRW